MGIKYDGLFTLLDEKGISKTGLQKKLGLSSTTLAKLSKNEAVSLKVIEDICRELSCQPGDIMRLVSDDADNRLLHIMREEKVMCLSGGIYHQTQIKLTYNSNRIEGSRLSEEQTRYIFETNTIGLKVEEAVNVDDIVETVNHFQCFDYILECADDMLTEHQVKKLHLILKSSTSDSRKEWFQVGDYKTKPNMVGDLKTTPPSRVKQELSKLINQYNEKKSIEFEDIIDFHYHFECIHPFQDGNGRIGRLIMFKECLKHDIVPFYIDETHKMFYYRGLKEYGNEKGYLIETCLAAQDRYQELLDYFGG